jgi:hypothetical protein
MGRPEPGARAASQETCRHTSPIHCAGRAVKRTTRSGDRCATGGEHRLVSRVRDFSQTTGWWQSSARRLFEDFAFANTTAEPRPAIDTFATLMVGRWGENDFWGSLQGT